MIKFLVFISLFVATPLLQAHQIPNFSQVQKDMYRGGRPSAQDLKDLKAMGIKTILNVENDDQAVAEETKMAAALGFKFVSVPTASWKKPKDDKVDLVLQTLHEPKNYPIFIHCKHGQDRTGMMIGLYRVEAEGWRAEDAYQEMLDLGFHRILFVL